jgi:hypothetical protein
MPAAGFSGLRNRFSKRMSGTSLRFMSGLCDAQATGTPDDGLRQVA